MDVRGGFFTQLLFHDPISIQFSLRPSFFLELFVTWIVYFVPMTWHVSFSLYVNKPNACLEASRTQGLCAFLLGLLRFRGEEKIHPITKTQTHQQKINSHIFKKW